MRHECFWSWNTIVTGELIAAKTNKENNKHHEHKRMKHTFCVPHTLPLSPRLSEIIRRNEAKVREFLYCACTFPASSFLRLVARNLLKLKILQFV